VLPDGDGEVNPAGIEFYSNLVDALLEHDIEPWLTLYHWDLPQALEDRGGWPARSTVDAFVRYAEVVADALGDRVKHWITHNEPWVASMVGHRDGVFAPGRSSWGEALAAAHHLLLSHGRATRVIRDRVPGAKIGPALDCRPAYPATGSPDDIAAVRHFDGFRNRWFFDPVFGKGYPADVLDTYRDRGRFVGALPDFVHDGDMETIAAPIDFLGLNYYTSLPISARADESEDTGVPAGPHPPDGYTEMGWPITPDALRDLLTRIDRDYDPPSIVITENGASYSDGPGPDGRVADERRIAYLEKHLRAVGEARDAGVSVDGYFVWSLLDNLEWVSGFSQRFGLVWVDHTTQERVVKDSGRWYAGVIARRGHAG
jgi:beta-glucosidase